MYINPNFKPRSSHLQEPQTKPSAWMLLTHSSNLAMSVSSSQGFTSNKMEDLATTAGSTKDEDTHYTQLNTLPSAKSQCVSKQTIFLPKNTQNVPCVCHAHSSFCLAKKEALMVHSSFPTEECYSCNHRNSCRPVAVDIYEASWVMKTIDPVNEIGKTKPEVTLGELWKRPLSSLFNDEGKLSSYLLLAFFDSYCARRSSRSLFASSLSCTGQKKKKNHRIGYLLYKCSDRVVTKMTGFIRKKQIHQELSRKMVIWFHSSCMYPVLTFQGSDYSIHTRA